MLSNSLSLSRLLRSFWPILLIMLLNPFLGMVGSLVQLCLASEDWRKNRGAVITFMCAVAIWISLVNITKTITSDQLVYMELFRNVSKSGFYSTVFESWDGSGKEPVYSFITWILYYLCGGSLRLFFFTLSLIIYLFQYVAIYRLSCSMGNSKGTFICGIIILTFFSQYFVMTLHIIRQILAASIVMYAIVYRATIGRNNWLLLIISPLIHTSSFLFVIISLMPWLYQRLCFKRIILVLGCFGSMIVFNNFIGEVLGNISLETVSYAAQRLGAIGASDGGSINKIIMLMVLIPLGICALRILREYRIKELSKVNPYKPVLPIAYMSLLLIIFILSFSKSPLLQYRFFYYSYSFVPLLLPLLFKGSKLNRLYQLILSLFFVARFFITHNGSAFHYTSVANLMVQPITFYFTGNFSPPYLN